MMDEAVRARQLGLPAGIDRETRQPVTLERVLDRPDTLAAPEEVSTQEWIGLVRARWEAGEWSDLLYGHEEVDLAAAVTALDAQSAMGRDLLQITQRAIEMVLEDARESSPS